MSTHIRFGTAGIPLSTPNRSTQNGIVHVHTLGLNAMELEFVHGINISPEKTSEIKKTAEQHSVALSVHGPYYINLNAIEKEKQQASIQRIFDSAKTGSLCGATTVTFHSAYIQGMPHTQVVQTVQQNLTKLLERLNQNKILVAIKPETTGKPTQYGSLTDLLELYEQIPQIKPYIDFSHVHARDNGRFKTKNDVTAAFEQIEKTDKNLLKDLNMHLSGIAYSPKGEKNHLVLSDQKNDFPYKWVLECLHEFSVRGTVICESPNIETDALLMQKYFQNLK